MIVETCCKFIRPWEGCKLFPYRDVAGYPTIGYGKLLTRDKTIPLSYFPPITQAQAEQYLAQEVSKVIQSVLRLTKGVLLTENQLVALVDFCFNLGAGAFQASTLRKCILRNESPERITRELLRWNRAGGKVYKGLTRRRTAEAKLFCS